jgi:hypothetical protein
LIVRLKSADPALDDPLASEAIAGVARAGGKDSRRASRLLGFAHGAAPLRARHQIDVFTQIVSNDMVHRYWEQAGFRHGHLDTTE